VQLAVAGALELLEDDLVHLRAGVDQRRADDRQAAALFDVAGGAEEALRLLQGVGIDTTGQDLAGVRHFGVVGAARRVIESSRITTSLPYSTRRLAFSMTISATCTCRLAGSSKVELMTSASCAAAFRSLPPGARRSAAR
jgi:hypothetical protein